MATIVLKETGKTLQESFEKIFKHFNYIPRGKIFIKPNFSARPPIIKGENTDPFFLEKLSKFLIKEGAREVIIGHGALLGIKEKNLPFEKIINKGGFNFLRDIEGVNILNIDEAEQKTIEFNGVKFSIPKILEEVDFYINLAKMKSHMETDVSLSLKNQMGLVSPMDRVNIHKNNLDDYIAYIGKLVRPNISIIDGIVAMEGNGPHDGKSRRLNLLTAGDDMVELDSLTSYLLGFDYEKILHIATAQKLGVGNYPAKALDTVSKYKIHDFVKPEKFQKFLKNIYVWPGKSCSRCITVLKEYGTHVKKQPFKNLKFIKKAVLGKKRVNIIIGRADELELSDLEKNICIGFCTRNFAKKHNIKNLDKCPPSIKETIEYINKELNL